MTDRDIVATLNLIADQIVSEGMTVRASQVRAGAVEITRLKTALEFTRKQRSDACESANNIISEHKAEVARLRGLIDGYERERISRLGGIGSPA